jgi:hypothetical protein
MHSTTHSLQHVTARTRNIKKSHRNLIQTSQASRTQAIANAHISFQTFNSPVTLTPPLLKTRSQNQKSDFHTHNNKMPPQSQPYKNANPAVPTCRLSKRLARSGVSSLPFSQMFRVHIRKLSFAGLPKTISDRHVSPSLSAVARNSRSRRQRRRRRRNKNRPVYFPQISLCSPCEFTPKLFSKSTKPAKCMRDCRENVGNRKPRPCENASIMLTGSRSPEDCCV